MDARQVYEKLTQEEKDKVYFDEDISNDIKLRAIYVNFLTNKLNEIIEKMNTYSLYENFVYNLTEEYFINLYKEHDIIAPKDMYYIFSKASQSVITDFNKRGFYISTFVDGYDTWKDWFNGKKTNGWFAGQVINHKICIHLDAEYIGIKEIDEESAEESEKSEENDNVV